MRCHFVLGYVIGNVLGVFSILNILVFNLMSGFQNFSMHIPSLVYPVVLLLLLNLRYREDFT